MGLALAENYGFTPEEWDFIINYDIKYRLGRDNETEDEQATRFDAKPDEMNYLGQLNHIIYE